ncbi:GH25 family lysozyme [Clostridium akagii]|uniref:GH25 family lysozyme n=1 Tax=Clostridium akagii TaxID=91623 RepID=UPI00047C7AB2|nr:GH25 family lysozyme [Clostridium akagii]
MKTKNRILTMLVAFTFVFATFLFPLNVQAVTTYKGVDVYEYDNISNYQQFKDTGTQVVIQKATEGLYHNDSLLYYRYNHLLQYGFKVGFYHYADNTSNPTGEAQHFLNEISVLHSDTVLWLDIENEGEWSKDQAISYTNAFINYVQAKGYKVGLYTGQSFYHDYLEGNISSVPLWLANYSTAPTLFPNSLSWQYSGTGRIDGVIGDIDLDYFNSSIFTGKAPSQAQATKIKDTTSTQFWGGYDIDKVRSLQKLLNGLGIAKLNEDGKLGTQTLRAMARLPVAKYSNYHNSAYTNWLEIQLGKTPDNIFGNGMSNTVKTFQRSKGISADSKVGIQTLKELLK